MRRHTHRPRPTSPAPRLAAEGAEGDRFPNERSLVWVRVGLTTDRTTSCAVERLRFAEMPTTRAAEAFAWHLGGTACGQRQRFGATCRIMNAAVQKHT